MVQKPGIQVDPAFSVFTELNLERVGQRLDGSQARRADAAFKAVYPSYGLSAEFLIVVIRKTAGKRVIPGNQVVRTELIDEDLFRFFQESGTAVHRAHYQFFIFKAVDLAHAWNLPSVHYSTFAAPYKCSGALINCPDLKKIRTGSGTIMVDAAAKS
jgi:hypothetical protein